MNQITLTGIDTGNKFIDAAEDRWLIRAVADGDEAAFLAVYQRYNRQIFTYLLNLTGDSAGAEDLLQEVFIAIWRGAARFEQRSSLKTWIYRIANKQAISWLRKHKNTTDLADLVEAGDAMGDLEETVIVNNQALMVQRAMLGLTVKHRAVIELVFVHDMSYSEIANVLECPVGTVKSRMSYALRNLNKLLVKMGIDQWGDTSLENRR